MVGFSKPKKLVDMSVKLIKKFFNSFDTVLTDCDGKLFLMSAGAYRMLFSSYFQLNFHYNTVNSYITLVSLMIFCNVGVLWLGDTLIPGSETVMNGFRNIGKRIFYVTNNSSKARDGYVQKCQNLGLKAEKDEIISTSYLVASYLSDIGFKKKAYVVGLIGITEELECMGIKSIKTGPDPLVWDLETLLHSEIKLDPDVGAVIVAYDDHISLPKIIKAANYLRDPNCLFLGTSTEGRKVLKEDFIVPGAGSMVSAVSSCSERDPVIVGKPYEYVMNVLTKKFSVCPARTLMIGDNARADIAFGKRCGFQTLLVLSGISTLSDLEEWVNNANTDKYKDHIPDFYAEKLGDLEHFFSC